MIEKLVMHLEMDSPGLLRPAAPVDGLQVARIDDAAAAADAVRVRSLHDAIATPHHWSSLARSEEGWATILTDGGWSHWVARQDGMDVGWSCLAEDDAGVEVLSFGLLPGAVGKGLGGAFLTEVVRRAWEIVRTGTAGGAMTAPRVWLHTSSWDHPHALANYLARGFKIARMELREQHAGDNHRRSSLVNRPPRFLVRPAVPADAEAVVPLMDRLDYDVPLEVARERLEQRSSSRDDVVAVGVEHGSDVVGFISAHVVPLLAECEPGFVRITSLCVAPRAVRNGVATRLLGFVEYVAARRGISLIEVSSGRRPARDAAHRFYETRGFEDTSAEAVRYWKRLADGPIRSTRDEHVE